MVQYDNVDIRAYFGNYWLLFISDNQPMAYCDGSIF